VRHVILNITHTYVGLARRSPWVDTTDLCFDGISTGKMFDDLSGLECTDFDGGYLVRECDCHPSFGHQKISW
jgi:hypothetical protein